MNKNIKDFIFFTDKEDIDKLNHEIQGNFLLKRDEIKDENIEKVQFDNLKFGIYFSKSKENKERILVLKNKKKIKCGHFFINGIKKEFYTDLYFLIMHQEEKDRNIIFEELIEKILEIIKIKDINL
ncbi:hypothetical protein JMUB4039_1958 [Leptotrichia trevisanii]|jgi:hypothetical protein|uniref:Uncharacterized protein n=1 Tax=Leptotrichia trevisanii TaxID=109328 RepID=A0A510K2T3_9FUSO|nr:hypothetical protein [Leptotrichia trevisanii]BBM45980.1 hypothetical protein JMUB3870_2102 [Leptotrichia trevisanii]BBM53191.1 hypothetical protein JMUB3935_2173 [Leptotrichia trevisanii]BBM57976.1 hypothetical protein JMUB4039_1958 [Leptotrichia trevisanii]